MTPKVLMNAGALLFVSGRAHSIVDGVALARVAVANGAAAKVFEKYIHLSVESASLLNLEQIL